MARKKSLRQIMTDLREGKKIETFEDTDQETVIDTVENTNTPTGAATIDSLSPADKKLIIDAYRRIKRRPPPINKLIIIIIIAIIIYLLWKIFGKFACNKSRIKFLAMSDNGLFDNNMYDAYYI